jgi:hypothetical protein
VRARQQQDHQIDRALIDRRKVDRSGEPDEGCEGSRQSDKTRVRQSEAAAQPGRSQILPRLESGAWAGGHGQQI